MLKKEFPREINIDIPKRALLFGGDRINDVIMYSVVIEEDRAIGVASLSLNGDYNTPEIVGVFVEEPYRKNGYSKLMIKELSEYFFSLNEEITSKGLCIQLISKSSFYLKDFCESLGIVVHGYGQLNL